MKKSTENILWILSVVFLLAAAVVFAVLVIADIEYNALMIGISGVCFLIGVAIIVITGFFNVKAPRRPDNEQAAKHEFITCCIIVPCYTAVIYYLLFNLLSDLENTGIKLILFAVITGLYVWRLLESYKQYKSFRKK